MKDEQAPRPTVLIVDDEPTMLRLLIDTLEPAGFNVLVALQGEMALVLLDQITPDVIVLDAMMPGIDGFETCRRIKQRAALALVPVIFMTGLTETTNIVEGLQAGGVDYVTKPVAPTELIARIKVHLANAQLTRSAQLAMDVSGRYLLATDSKGRLRWCTQQAGRLLGIPASGAGLAPEVTLWLQAKLSPGRDPVPDTITIFAEAAGDAARGLRRSGSNSPSSASSRAMNICSASSNSIPTTMSNACNHACR